MIVPIETIESPYGEERFKELDREWIETLKSQYRREMKDNGYIQFIPILITKDYKIIDGHHRLLAYKEVDVNHVPVVQLNCFFEETDMLRSFQKHLKGMYPVEWEADIFDRLKKEFDLLLPWIIQHSIN